MIFFHIGYPKTASTWMQQKLFPNITNCIYIDDNITKNLFLKSDVFLFSKEKIQSFLYRYPENSNFFFSSELLTTAINYTWHYGAISKSCADKIQHAFPNAQIIIFIRNQQSLLCSGYMQYIKNGGNHSLKRFINSESFFSKEHLYFDKLIEYYDNLFGKDNVYVFTYEEFHNNPRVFTKSFCDKLGLRVNIDDLNFQVVNPGLRKYYLPLIRLANLFHNERIGRKFFLLHIPKFRVFINFCIKPLNKSSIFGKFLKSDDMLDENDKLFFENAYKDSNRKLAERIGYDKLIEYGYYL